MRHSWLDNLKDTLPKFLNGLKRNEFNFNPVNEGITDEGAHLNLGMSCYALKIYYMTGLWDSLSDKEKNNWTRYINSFQISMKEFPDNSFIDKNYLDSFRKFSLSKNMKNLLKTLINIFRPNTFILDNEKIQNFIRAESKQAISTLFQVNSKNDQTYGINLNDKEEMSNYLNNLDWTKPWNAGAQFSAMCVFAATQKSDEKDSEIAIKQLKDFAFSIADKKSGTFFAGKKPDQKELINGAMKVITGLDWINAELPFPENLIDTCLDIEPYEEGCDLVDLVYVLYMCSKITDYKEEEIKLYLEKVLNKIEKHYFFNSGGFSYYVGRSQTLYYGVKISQGKKTPDLHGTVLLVWAISMISELIELPTSNWKVLKP